MADQPKKKGPTEVPITKQDVKLELTSPIAVNIGGTVELKVPLTPSAHAPEFWYQNAEVWLVLATFILVGVTAALAFYTRGLWSATVKLAEDAKKTGERQADDTLKALRVAVDSASATKLSVDLARAEFEASHRPVLVVRQLTIVPTGGLLGDKNAISYVIANIGDTPARIISVVVTSTMGEPHEFLFAGFPPKKVSTSSERHDLGDLPSGHERRLLHEIGDEGLPIEGRHRFWDLAFFGDVIYEYSNGVRRRTAFYRRYQPDTHSFRFMTNPDFEYRD